MRFYFGNEDIRYIIEGYSRDEKELIIKYMDGSSNVIFDDNREYENLLRDKMIRQLRERNANFDFNDVYRKMLFDSVALSSIYISLAAYLIKCEGDINGMICFSSFFLGALGIDRNINAFDIIRDIKKTNMFLEINDNIGDFDFIDVNNIDFVTYGEMKKIYRRAFRR